MTSGKRPVAVLVVACLFIVVGAAGLVAHFPHRAAFHQEDIWIELTELLAVIAGTFILRGHNWARWLALAWMAFHVVISWPSVSKLAIHTFVLAVFAWALFAPGARRYFAKEQNEGVA
jgi:hypothetical protein